ncbi:glycoside hydrolase family 65 protein [Bowmanella dokdonensis]|uniref:Glycoside hydrolase family 65 protein n=1 Tax=Bowmanella dokdonensis TaxID=751969 RepID=A0A939ILB6_9ALTE|nr:glycoside hydrolase family 65 protein [Bowmanella dokdonensis]MBN7824038.1 glycoside hydrolase family 65 protein [Bowmanella dokdonensis]
MKVSSKDLLFAPEPWSLSTDSIQSQQAMLEETLFALANGYLGSRGTLEEGRVTDGLSCEGTYLNGVYHSEKITYGEVAYGYASHNQKMQQVPNGKWMQWQLDGELVSLATAQSGRRWLDMQTATLHRQMQWQSQTGKQLSLHSRRIASLSHPNLLCLQVEICAENFSGPVQLRSLLDAGYSFSPNQNDPRVGKLSMADSLHLEKARVSEDAASMLHEVKHSPFRVASLITHSYSDQPASCHPVQDNSQLGWDFTFELKQGQPLVVEKYVLYQHSRSLDFNALETSAAGLLNDARNLGWDRLYQAHKARADEFWQCSDVQIDGDPALQQGIRFNLLHLFMSVGKDGQSNMGAKGLTGHGYDGHYFWDTEIYILSFMTATNPELARKCLEFRYHTLDGARNRARQMSHSSGALYPWRTIGGDECSAFFPAGTAQYHINAAVAHAIRHYYQATDDWPFMLEMGAEMLFETARLWLDLGHFNPHKGGLFCIDGVTGPDEYTAIVNNNVYTNAMARAHLQFAARMAGEIQQSEPQVFEALAKRLGLSEFEVIQWQEAADKMYLPFDETLQIHAQDDTFLDKKPWDFASTPAQNYPLLLHYHPLVIYRHQVLKQADVVLAMYLLDDAFSKAQKKRNLDYYEPLTTHDSTLSSCIHSIEFAETGNFQRAYEFFHDTVRMDIDNRHGNTEYGIHTACMAGSWMSIVHGFAGLRIRADEVVFNPVLPGHWQGYVFNLTCHGRQLKVEVGKNDTTYLLREGDPMVIKHAGHAVSLQQDKPQTLRNQESL